MEDCMQRERGAMLTNDRPKQAGGGDHEQTEEHHFTITDGTQGIKLRFRNKELKSVTVPPDSRTDAPQMILSLHASSGVWSATCARRIASKPPHDAVDSSRGL